MKVKIGISARHIHLNQQHLDILFGKDYRLTSLKQLSQPGQFAAEEVVSIKTSKDQIDHVRVVGPVRTYTQVEISKTDAVKLGIKPPVRRSGDLKGSSPITVIGPNGTIELEEGCIIAARHIHVTKEDVKKYGLENIARVSVLVEGIKGGIMDNVIVRTSDDYSLEMHIDTDDGNAHLLNQGDIGKIIIGDKDEKSI